MYQRFLLIDFQQSISSHAIITFFYLPIAADFRYDLRFEWLYFNIQIGHSFEHKYLYKIELFEWESDLNFLMVCKITNILLTMKWG